MRLALRRLDTPAASRSRWVVVTLLWSLVCALTAWQTYYAYARKENLTVAACVLSGLAYGGVWLLASPAILWLLRRFPLIRNRLPLSLAVHLPASLLIGGANHMATLALMTWIPGMKMPALEWSWLVRSAFLRVDVEALTYWGFVGLWEGVAWYVRYEEGLRRQADLETQLARAQLDALRMQLNPHFLFNTLHTISTMIHIDPTAADRMVVRLSEFLRLTLDSAGTQESSLEEELQFVRRYLDIEKIRFCDRLNVVYDIEAEALHCVVPRLILQPLVENAILHGVSKLSHDAEIAIRARVAPGGHLCLSVSDNGPGTGPSPEEGVGLRNTKERLARLYGEDHSIEVRNGQSSGVEAIVVIPLRASEGELASAHRG